MGGAQAKGQDTLMLGSRKFTVGPIVGKGSYGKVHILSDKGSGRTYAIKFLSKQRIMAQGVGYIRVCLRERAILAGIDESPFIVNLRAARQDDDNLYMILDFMHGGDLLYHLRRDGRFDETRARFYAACIVLGLEHIHNKGIIHRDLKPANLMLDGTGYLRLTDFNIAKEITTEGEKVTGFAGTMSYSAPELWHNLEYGPEVDIWSLGICLYEFLRGKTPWGFPPGESTIKWLDENYELAPKRTVKHQHLDVVKRIMRAKVPMPKRFSEEARDLLEHILCPQESRYTLEQVKSHPFFDAISWRRLQRQQLDAPFLPEEQLNVDRRLRDDSEQSATVSSHSEESAERRREALMKPLSHEDQTQFNNWDWIPDSFNISKKEAKELRRSSNSK